MKIEITKEIKTVLDKISLQMTESINDKNDTRIKNLEAVSANLNKKIVYSIYAIMQSMTPENHEVVKSLVLENEENIKDTKIFNIVNNTTGLIAQKLAEHFKSTLDKSKNEVDSYAMSVLLLIRICERSPYVLPLDLEHYKALRSFLRKTIKPSRAKNYNIETIDARSSIIQEIKKFNNEFYCSVLINDLDEMILDSKFKFYNFSIVDRKENSKDEMKALRNYIKTRDKVRAKIHLEDGKLFLITRKENLEIDVLAFTKKDINKN